jgi:hypothetical protein
MAACLIAVPEARAQTPTPHGSVDHPYASADSCRRRHRVRHHGPITNRFRHVRRTIDPHVGITLGESYSALVEGICT